MTTTSIRRGRGMSIRTRVLTIALVPCVVFLLAGVANAGYSIFDAARTRSYYNEASVAQSSALPLIVSLQEERRLTLRRLASYGTFQSDLQKQRQRTDALTGAVTTSLGELSGAAPDSVRKNIAEFTTLMTRLPELRAKVDSGQVGITESFAFYDDIIDQFVQGTQGLALFAPDAETSYHQLVVAPLLTAADRMQRADALAAADVVAGGLTPADFRTYQAQVSAYHLQLDTTIPLADQSVQNQYAKLRQTPAWQRLQSVEGVLLDGKTELPITEDLWRAAAREVGDGLMDLLTAQSRITNEAALDRVDGTLIRSIIAGVLMLLLAAAAAVITLRLSRRLIDRLVRLRRETLELARTRLPELVERVRSGVEVTVEDAGTLIEHGADEIGEVADAFNQAQRTAVAAAVQEAQTREGTNKVFLNIAHRSQVIVHRQLKLLDEAERGQEDPEQLETLFQLDHLSTRARRNAENLIILGGGQPGRRWRNPVSLTELVRGAAAETEYFARVKITKLPRRAVNGQAVGDCVHLLAELIDNATAFSPPDSRVEVRGGVVGRGVALEIEDQGLGIKRDRVDELNAMLADPPDFGIMALSDEPRLGLFVVARLAARHGISVSLRESAYGGTQAVVLIRAELLGDVPDPPPTAELPAATPTPEPDKPAARLPLSIADLPPLPLVPPRPGEDLFRPQHPVEEPIIMSNDSTGGRPALPRRSRQQNLVPQLKDEPVPDMAGAVSGAPVEVTPEQARNRVAAFQQGSRRGRAAPLPELTQLTGESGFTDDTVGSIGNGQHRYE